MTIVLKGHLEIGEFQNQNSGEPSNWSLRLRRQDSFVTFALYWGDKETATHVAFANLDAFKQAVASL